MLRIAICDDDAVSRTKVKRLMEAWLADHPELDVSLRTFPSGRDLADRLEAGDSFELYLLDVLMPGLSGISLGQAIRERDSRATIIYLTSSPNYAVQSYGVRAFHYLLKPCGAKELYPVLDDLVERFSRAQTAMLPVRTHEGVVPVRLAELVCTELKSHAAHCHLADGNTVVSQTLRGSFDQFLSPLLEDRRFLKVGASYAVNLSFVRSLSGREFMMAGGRCVPIPRNALPSIRDAYLEYLSERGRG